MRSSKRHHVVAVAAATPTTTTTTSGTDSSRQHNESNHSPSTPSRSGACDDVLVPAAALTNLHSQTSIRCISRVFIVRPPTGTLWATTSNLSLKKPLLVLINPKSGGTMGSKLLKKFTWLLNARQVFDLTQNGGPKLP